MDALLPAFGGPAGAHVRRRGVFFQPLPWAIGVAFLVFTVLYLRHLPCLTTDPNNPINAYIRVCYSDLAANYSFRDWSSGMHLLGGAQLDFPPLLALVITLSGWAGRLIELRFGPGANEYTGLSEFFGASAILLFGAFLLLVVCSAWLARRRGRPWDVLLIAASPVVLAAGLTSWDLFALSLTAFAVVAYEAERFVEAGLLLAFAFSSATMPLAFAVAVIASLALRRRWRDLLRFVAPLVGVTVLIFLPQLMASFSSVIGFFVSETRRDVSYGSLWYLIQISGVPLREFGSLLFILLLVALGLLLAWLYVRQRRPSAHQIFAATVLLVVLLGPAYPPQLGLWVLFALFLVRPADHTLWLFSAVQALHYLAVWGRLSGHLTAEQSGPWLLYYAAVLVRVAFEMALLIETMGKLARCPAWLGTKISAGSGKPHLVEDGRGHADVDRDFVTDVDRLARASDKQH